MAAPAPAELDRLIGLMRAARGVDLAVYRPAALARRITSRIDALGLPTLARYLDHLELDAREMDRLLDAVFINVTAFLRDADVWAYLGHDIIPHLGAPGEPDAPLRLWSAGCATGEEAYSLAILMAEHLGIDGARRRVRIFGTDIDDSAMERARRGVYSTERLAALSPERRDRFFEPHGSDWRFRADLREVLVFGRHDLTADTGISRIDLLTCRNTLMYFTAETQSAVAARLHAALAPSGYLVLGRVEMLLDQGQRFVPVHHRHRIFARLPAPHPTAGLPGAALGDPHESWQPAVERSPLPQLALDLHGRVMLANAAARRFFGIGDDPVGRPATAWCTGISEPMLGQTVAAAVAARTPARLRAAHAVDLTGRERSFDAWLAPLVDLDGLPLGASLVAVETPPPAPGTDAIDLEPAVPGGSPDPRTHEASAEDLQSSREDLETTREELHSANEELATTNEQLHATNEELRDMNQQLLQRSNELAAAGDHYEGLLRGLPGAVIAMDRAAVVTEWNDQAEELWGLRRAEAVGTSLWSLDFGLPLPRVRELCATVLAGSADTLSATVDAVNRRGRSFRCRVHIAGLADPGGTRTGVSFFLEAEAAGA
ncbi:MAG: CheR family methyltransferase [Planctomycetota bacterium]|jgi:two-component system CheB/CheR fusion protein